MTKFFLRCLVFLVKFGYLSKFHVNIVPGPGVTTIFFDKGLTRNQDIGNTFILALAKYVETGAG